VYTADGQVGNPRALVCEITVLVKSLPFVFINVYLLYVDKLEVIQIALFENNSPQFKSVQQNELST
jgi:hypothetical protein